MTALGTDLLGRLRDGDDEAFCELVDRYAPAMLRVARVYVPSHAVAEEVVQETWLDVLQGLGRFEGRSPLKTWVFQVLINRARTRGERERRTLPFATLAAREARADEPAIAPERVAGRAHPARSHWGAPGEGSNESPDRSLQSLETLRVVREAIERLSPMQRLVITMRDAEGWDSREVRDILGLSETNQRVLLHRARARVRTALAAYLAPAPVDEHAPA